MVDGNTDPDVRFHVEIAMVEVYMDEVYDLLEPRKKAMKQLFDAIYIYLWYIKAI